MARLDLLLFVLLLVFEFPAKFLNLREASFVAFLVDHVCSIKALFVTALELEAHESLGANIHDMECSDSGFCMAKSARGRKGCARPLYETTYFP